MSFIGGLFSGSQGANFQAQQGATAQQAQDLYNQQQQQLAQQQAFQQAIGAQAPGAIAQQQQVAQQLAQQAQGLGPNVAQSQLAQATGQNVANQAALAAGQRGASSNAGLIARQAAQAGGAAQQQAAGQAATLGAQQQLAAQQGLANLSAQQLGQIQGANQLGIQGTQGAQGNILGAVNSQNAVNAQIASGNQGFQSGLVGGALGAAGTAVKTLFADGGMVGQPAQSTSGPQSFVGQYLQKNKIQNYADGGNVGNKNWYEQGVSQFAMPSGKGNYEAGKKAGEGAADALTGLGKGIGSLFSSGASGQPGGGYAGANLGVNTAMPAPINPLTSSSAIGNYQLPNLMPGSTDASLPLLAVGMAHGGKVDAMLSPGEKYLPPHLAHKVAEGKANAMKDGKSVPGKAKVHGDSLKNDTFHTKLDVGGIVIPRSVTQSKDPAEQARKFVAAVMVKQAAKRKS